MREQWDDVNSAKVGPLLKAGDILKRVRCYQKATSTVTAGLGCARISCLLVTALLVSSPNLPVVIQIHILKYTLHLFSAEIIITTRKMSQCAIPFSLN